jgi:hypothetical protein
VVLGVLAQFVEQSHATALQDVVCTLFKYTNLGVKASGIAEIDQHPANFVQELDASYDKIEACSLIRIECCILYGFGGHLSL